MSTTGRLQKLLRTDEYPEFKNQNIILESQFVELTHKGDPIKAVIIGITDKFFIVAMDVINDLRKSRASVLVPDIDIDTVDLELEWVVPNMHVIPEPVHNELVLDVRGHNDHHRYFMVSITRGNGSRNKIWTKWMKHLAKNSPVPDQFLKEIPPKFNMSMFKKDKTVSDDAIVKSSVHKVTSIAKVFKNKMSTRKKTTPCAPIANKLPRIPTDLYDTRGIIKEKKKSCLCCFPRRKKRIRS
ncbi:uncharacterized protein LOC125659409 [Ostrea edulis]|uniref:uncharacterized protein LOC125659409 n=1 Tax=Ostrea edulis TaxID=37623 RepID=UPI002094D8C6|nr:uncharacterized protein LOC125659409 [Ostrea edulis]